MIKFINIFLENLIGNSMTSIVPSESTLLSTTSVTATGTTELGSALIDKDNEGLTTTGSITTSIGTGVSINGVISYNQTIKQLETTQAYVESLNEEELNTLIEKLEIKEENLIQKENSNVKKM